MSNAVGSIPEVHEVVDFFDADEFSDQPVAGQDFRTTPADISDGGDFADHGAVGVFDGGQFGGTTSFAGSPASNGRDIAQSLVGPDRVVDVSSPLFQSGLEVFEVVAGKSWEDLGFERAVESFDLALGLRVVRERRGRPVA